MFLRTVKEGRAEAICEKIPHSLDPAPCSAMLSQNTFLSFNQLWRCSMQYSERDLPVRLHDGEMLVLDNGNELRWESNGEAKAVFVGSGFDATMELFPGQEEPLSIDGKNFVLTAFFEDALEVKKG